MNDNERIAGVLANVEYTRTSKSGWKNYRAAFENGQTFDAVFPPDVNYTPKVGDTLSFKKGKFNGWVVDQSSIPLQGSPPPTSPSSSGNTDTSLPWGSNEYFQYKFNYEIGHKDPRLEFQGYLNNISAIYAACASSLTTPPHRMENKEVTEFIDCVDGLVDSCFAKTKEVFRRVNKKTIDEADTPE